MLKRPNLKMFTAVGNNGSIYGTEKLENFDCDRSSALLIRLQVDNPEDWIDAEKHLKLSKEFLRKAGEYGLHLYNSRD